MTAPFQTQTEEFVGSRLATSAQPPRATAAFSRHASSQHAPQPIRSLVTLDSPGVLLKGLRCLTAFRPLTRPAQFQEGTDSRFAFSPGGLK